MRDIILKLERMLLAEQASLQRNIHLLKDELDENRKALALVEELKAKT